MRELYADSEGAIRLARAQMRMHNASKQGAPHLGSVVRDLPVGNVRSDTVAFAYYAEVVV
jgi:hypothetical protein